MHSSSSRCAPSLFYHPFVNFSLPLECGLNGSGRVRDTDISHDGGLKFVFFIT